MTTTQQQDAPRSADPQAFSRVRGLLESLRHELSETLPLAGSETDAVDFLTLIEQTANQLAGLKAVTVNTFYDHRVAAEKAQGVPAAQRGKGVAEEISRATTTDIKKATGQLKFARTLCTVMPRALQAMLHDGTEKSENIEGVARRIKHTSPEQQREIDQKLAEVYGTTTGKKLASQAATIASRLDPDLAARREKEAHSKRNVRVTSVGDGMSTVSAYLPTAQALEIEALLKQHATAILNSGDTSHPSDPTGEPRTEDQLWADLFYEFLITGPATPTGPADPSTAGQPATPRATRSIELMVVMNQDTLFGLDDELVYLSGGSPITAERARRWLAHEDASVFIRRLFRAPGEKDFVKLESRSRAFSAGLRKLILLRDDRCRTPWCDNRIDEIDHITRHADGGVTSFDNAQGLCKFCNQAKENRGWRADTQPDGSIIQTMPTGHTYTIPPPALYRSDADPPLIDPDQDPDPPF